MQSYHVQIENKQIIQEFSKNRLTLRPTSLKKIVQFLKDRQDQLKNAEEYKNKNYIGQIIEKLKQNVVGTNIIEDDAVQQVFEFILLPEESQKNNFNQENEKSKKINKNKTEVDIILQNRIENSILLIDNFKEVPIIKKDYKGISVQEIKNKKIDQANKINGLPQTQIEVLRSRFETLKSILQDCTKYKHTLPKKTSENEEIVLLQDVGALRGSKDKNTHSLGIIYENKGYKGQYLFQDLYTSVRLDVSQAYIDKGYVTSNCIVIVRGEYNDINGQFIVKEVILPEIITRDMVNNVYGQNQDMFGNQIKIHNILSDVIELELKKNKQNKFTKFDRERQKALGFFDLSNEPLLQNNNKQELNVMLISDFRITNRATLDKFDTLLNGANEFMTPLAFVLMGQFFDTNDIRSEDDYYEIEQACVQFAQIVKKYPNLENQCYFIFVPHVQDIGTHVQPRQEISLELFEYIEKNIPFCVRAQNPCRLSIFGKEIFIQRNDIIKDLRQKSLIKNNSDEINLHLAYTILSQGIVNPLCSMESPILWNYYQSLQFVNPPHFIIIADQNCNQFYSSIEDIKNIKTNQNSGMQEEVEENQNVNKNRQNNKQNQSYIINPGSFQKHGRFTNIFPLTNEIQESEI